MCGIAGLVCFDRKCSGAEHEHLVRQMCDVQAHRGPDDSGIVAFERVCLGSRRLSIIDLSPAGRMPMSDPTGRWWITYNGEVYNFRELRDDLERRGHRFSSNTDTEVVLHAFIEWGGECVERFDGMFAFAIYDHNSRTVVLARDRFGVKPLYHTRRGGHVLFSSEIKAFAQPGSRMFVNRRRILEWFLYRNAESLQPSTLFGGVSSVRPGHVETITPEGITDQVVYRAADHVSEERFREFARARVGRVVDELDTVLNDATRIRLVSDVPVGTLLSGGLDSSLITAIAARHTRDLTAFHVSISGFPRLDELRFAREVARHAKIELVCEQLTGATFRRELARAVYLSDLPLSHPNSVAYAVISRVAREHGVPVLLSGEGADEVFGGYAWNYRRTWYLERLQPLLAALPNGFWRPFVMLSLARLGMPVTSVRFRELLPPTIDLIDRYDRKNRRSECEQAYQFLARPADRAVLAAMLADLNDFLSPLLRRLDRMAMGASVESRVPFLDYRLVHRAINLPLRYRVGTYSDKWVLRKIAHRYVPRQIIRRRKAGFPLPLAEFLEPLATPAFFAGGFCQEQLGLDARGFERLLEGWRRWVFSFFGLTTFEIWGRIFIRGESPDTIRDHIVSLEPRAGRAG